MQDWDCPSSLSQRRLPEADGDIFSADVMHNVMRAAAASRPDELVVAWAFGMPHAGLDDRQCRVRGSRPCLTAKARGLVVDRVVMGIIMSADDFRCANNAACPARGFHTVPHGYSLATLH